MGKNVKNSDNSTRRGTEPRQHLEPIVVMMIIYCTISKEQKIGLQKSNNKSRILGVPLGEPLADDCPLYDSFPILALTKKCHFKRGFEIGTLSDRH